MGATEWAAWVGACTGVGGLLWNIYTEIAAGPKLRVTALAGLVKMPPPPGNPRFLRITVQNIGTAPTTITNITFHKYGPWWKPRRSREPAYSAAMVSYEASVQYPCQLGVGGEWSALMALDVGFITLLNQGPPLYVAIHHSFKRLPTHARIYQAGEGTS